MVVPPITVEQAVQQFLDTANKPTPNLPQQQQQPARTFGEEVMRHMHTGGTTAAQQTLVLSQATRPQTFIPLTSDGATMGGANSSTTTRKPNKHKKATAAYSSAPQGLTNKK